LSPYLKVKSNQPTADACQDWWPIFAPPPNLTISQWADKERRLSPEASAEPGKWDTSRAEYQRGMMDAVSDPSVAMVVIMSSAQVGKTELLLNLIGFHVSEDPAPILLVQPSLEMAEAFSKDRVAPMVRDTPALARRIAPVKTRDSGNTILHKGFPGGHLTMVGANSPSGLASRPIRIVLADEVDRYEVSAGTEGDPVNLAVKRTTTFWNRKIVLVSTPGIKTLSRIERAYEGSDKRRFHVPCPDCGHEQPLRWAQVHWSKEDGKHRAESAHYACEECGSLWSDVQRWSAVRKGRWIAEGEFTGVAGFHLNEFYSPWRRLAETVKDFLDAKDAPELLKTWTNTALGESWEDDAERVDAGSLLTRGEVYDEMSVPAAVRLVTAGVDVQGDRLEASRWGWGDGEESWLIEHKIFLGDPAQQDIWDELDEWLLTDCQTEDGATLKTKAACIDIGGHQGQQVLKFARDRKGRKVFAIKGMPGARPIWTPKASKSKVGKLSFYGVGVDVAKDTVYGRLHIQRKKLESGAYADGSVPGYVHLPMTMTASYVAQLVAETVVVRKVKGKPIREWILPSGARNEALDCAVYALAARESFGKRIPFGKRVQPSSEPIGERAEQELAAVPPERAAVVQKVIAPKAPRAVRKPWGAYRG
jgi:phage terminase large subunit GpA-like protein